MSGTNHRLTVMMLPYLSFKDMNQSSGIIHQTELAKALAAVGCNVVMLWPDEKGGWKYDASKLLSGIDNLTVQPVEFVRDQTISSGMLTDSIIREITPDTSSTPFDVLFSGIPPAGLGLKKHLGRVGFSNYAPALVTYYDIVCVPDELRFRGGYMPSFISEAMILEAASTLRVASVLHTSSEVGYLKRNLRKLFNPSTVLDCESRIHHVPRPYAPPLGVKKRVWKEGEPFVLYAAKSLGASREEGGSTHPTLFGAIRRLRELGHDVVLRFYTRSSITPWVENLVASAGEGAVDLRVNRPREEVLAGLYECPASVDLRDYDGLYMSSIEATTSGSPHICKQSKWSDGEIVTPWKITDWDEDELAAAILELMRTYPKAAEDAYQIGLAQSEARGYGNVGHSLIGVFEQEWDRLNPKFSAEKFKAMRPLFDDFPEQDMTLAEAVSVIEGRMVSGKLGRYTQAWVARMLSAIGREVALVGGIADPQWVVRKAPTAS